MSKLSNASDFIADIEFFLNDRSQGIIRKFNRFERWIPWIIASAGSMALVLLVFFAVHFTGYSFFTNPFMQYWFMLLICTITGLNIALLLFRTVIFSGYRPTAPVADDDLPTLGVIIPAFNEGPGVRLAIRSVLSSNYPANKLELICVDDGSQDNTWLHIQAETRGNPRVKLVRHKVNSGKRQGLLTGFAMTRAEVLVTMDSDSVICPDALNHLVSPLVRDPRVAAVAGNIRVGNAKAGLIPKLLKAAFVQSFDFMRVAQSPFGAVLCTPGALSAYRHSAVNEIREEWQNQTFLGRPNTIAEDRALTTLLLRQGHRSVMAREAMAYTEMPTKASGMIKMFLRWERGNARENLSILKFCHRRFRSQHYLPLMVEYLAGVNDQIISPILMVSGLVMCVLSPGFAICYLSVLLSLSILMQVNCLRQYKDQSWMYGVAYCMLWFTVLWWVVPYSIVTIADNNWMTRQRRPEVTPSRRLIRQGAQVAA